MKKSLIILTTLVSFFNSRAQVTPQVTSWIINMTGATGYNNLPSNVQTVQYSASQVYVSASSIPAYGIGPWAGNPNTPSNQNFVCKFTRTPTQNTGAPNYSGLGSIGLWSNGVAIFNPKDGQYWNSVTSAFTMGVTTTGFNRNALVYEGNSFDNCLGHPAPGGCYHNHVNPACLYNATLTTVHSPIIGHGYDGYPVYGAYAYSNPTNTTSAIKRMESSFVLAASTGSVLLGANTASAASSAAAATTRNGGPPVNASYPLGNMCEDYIYKAGAGDLDEHNGRFCYTPEYPNGTYAYFVTLTSTGSPAYPFVLGPSYYGVSQNQNNGHITISETTTVYTATTATVATGVNEAASAKIKYQLMPNPTNDQVYIYMDVESKNNVKGILFDAGGKQVKVFDYLQPSIGYVLDMRDLPSGIYNLILESTEQRLQHKIVKTQ